MTRRVSASPSAQGSPRQSDAYADGGAVPKRTGLAMRLLLRLFGVERQPGDHCGACVRFEDFTQPDDDPREPNGYCGNDWNGPYGGHWTHATDWCAQFKRREP